MKIHKTDIPPRSLLTPCLPGDYHDCFTYGMTCRRKISPDDLMTAFWTTMPGWVNTLLNPVSYTHLTLPTSDLVKISVGAVSLKKKQRTRKE